jgi:hypothetical protein
MRTIEVQIYKFTELSDSAKQRAISELSAINMFDSWWEFIYEDAENIGIKITSFGLDRNKECNGEWIEQGYFTAKAIIENHGESCETYKLAKQFISDWDTLVSVYSDGIDTTKVSEENEWDFDNDANPLEGDFLDNLLSEYANTLQREYEYLTSEEAIIDTILANEYEFTEEGKRV